MIQELTVENIAIIDRSQVQLPAGLTALTGETGAGKSLLIDAIGLALGGRADSDLVRSGALKGTVTLLADLRANPMALAKCAEHGVDVEGGQLVVQREISVEGRSTVRLNGKLAAVGTLREIGDLLVDLHVQHDHQSLLRQERQITFLDAWIGDEASRLIVTVGEKLAEADSTRRQLHSVRTNQREREQRLDMLRFQISEIEELAPEPGEMEELTIRRDRLMHAARLSEAAAEALDSLRESESSAETSLRAAVRQLDGVLNLDPSLSVSTDLLRAALESLSEGNRELSKYLAEIESDPDALELTAARIDSLQKLRRKYGDDEAKILDYLEQAKSERSLLEDGETSEAELAQRLASEEAELKKECSRLTQLRQRHAPKFAAEVMGQLSELGMERAIFESRIQPAPVSPLGEDAVEFFFSANSGEEARPLTRVASGGELSRVTLGLKVVLAGKAGVPTLIFDEVDTGLSGRAAAITAKKLEDLAASCQVIVISHLPQIAARAETHFRIEKVEQGGRVVTQVRRLRPAERVEEIARLLAGETISESALANAREMLRMPVLESASDDSGSGQVK